jgi:hypothetical protein
MMNVYEYMMEHKLIDNLLEACENDEQREAAKQYAKQICASFDPFINNVRERTKTEEDREALLNAILEAKGKRNAD